MLDAIKKGDDAKLALNIRNLMFTYDDLMSVNESGRSANWWRAWTRRC